MPAFCHWTTRAFQIRADADLLVLHRGGEGLVRRVDAGAGLLDRHQHLLRLVEVVHAGAIGAGERGRDHDRLVLDVDEADLVAVLGVEPVLETGRGCRDDLGIVDHHVARIDVTDAIGILHRGDEILGVRDLGVVDRLDDAGLVHITDCP